jgi:3-oxoacyl-[acyl-carrier protein] reductase
MMAYPSPGGDRVTSAGLAGRVALVTGASRGLGREIAVQLAATGARVALIARDHAELDAVAAEIRSSGGSALALAADLADPVQAQAAVALAARQFGAIEVLINNAAVVWPLIPTWRLDPVVVAAALAINVGAILTLTAATLPPMLAGGWGRIVNVSSGVVANPRAMLGGTVYVASKAAVELHTVNLAAELEGSGVTANVYRPGAVDTGMQTWIREQDPSEIGLALHERFALMHSQGRLIAPQRAAAALLLRLAGQGTGQVWDVNDEGAS